MTVATVLELANVPRLLLGVRLKPVQGSRFQPTGFPDLGPAEFQFPPSSSGEATRTGLLVESAQSMANRLEMTCWDDAADDLIDACTGLSYVKVLDRDGAFLTSSILEAHRLNSHYIETSDKGAFKTRLEEEIGVSKAKPISHRRFLETLLKYDASSLLHGVFLESIDGRLRLPRALSAFIEAEDVNVVRSGGVKNDRVSPTKQEGKGAQAGQGNVPFHREEYTARRITAHFNLDLSQIRGYGLEAEVEQMLIALALFKIRQLLDSHLRLRTACDLEVVETTVSAVRPDDFYLPGASELEAVVRQSMATCQGKMSGTTIVRHE